MFLRFDEELKLGLSKKELERLVHGPDGTTFRPMEPGTVFDLGGRRIEVLATPGHTPGSVCFLERERRALYTGDTVCARGILLSLPHSCSCLLYTSIRRRQQSKWWSPYRALSKKLA